MPRPDPQLNPLQSRKRLLLAESELNRAQLVGDAAALGTGLRALGTRAKSIEAVATAAAVLFSALAAGRRLGSAEPAPKRPWLTTLIRGAGLLSSLWLAFRTDRSPPSAAP
jgi:hypothetical protein